MNEEKRYHFMCERIKEHADSVIRAIREKNLGYAACSNLVEQYMYFCKGCIYVCKCFSEITSNQARDLNERVIKLVALMNETICREVLHEDCSSCMR